MDQRQDEVTISQALELAIGYHKAGRYNEAKEIYTQILTHQPTHADALHLLGVTAIQEKEYATAIRLIAAAIELRPDDSTFFCNLASALHASDNFDDAAAMYQHALRLSPGYADAYFNLGNTFQAMGKFDQAIECYQQALSLKPDYPEAMHSIGCVLHVYNQYAEAIEWHSRALELHPGFVEACFMLGKALFRTGHVQQATEWYLKHKQLLVSTNENAYFKTSQQLVLPLMTVKSWSKARHGLYQTEFEEALYEVPPPKFLDGGHELAVPSCKSTLSEIYLAEIPQASILGWHDIVLAEKGAVALYDMAANDTDGQIESEHWSILYLSTDHVLLDSFHHSGQSIDRGIMFSGRGRDSYAHWVIDFLSKCLILERHPEYGDWPLIVDEGLYPQQIEALQFLAGNRQLITIKHNHMYEVGRLVMISDMSHMRMQSYRPNSVPSCREALVSPDAVSYLREKFGALKHANNTGKLLYVSRKHQKAFRQMVNEEEVEALFESYGFEIVFPEKLSFFEQVKMFANARVIAGGAGSNMINTIFSPADAKILMLTRWTPKLNYYFFSNIAQMIGQELTYVLGETAAHRVVHYQSDFFMPLDNVKKGIETVIG